MAQMCLYPGTGSARRQRRSCTHHGTLGELVELEHTHGAVPDDGLALLEGIREGLDAVRANVQTLGGLGEGREKAAGAWGRLVLANVQLDHASEHPASTVDNKHTTGSVWVWGGGEEVQR